MSKINMGLLRNTVAKNSLIVILFVVIYLALTARQSKDIEHFVVDPVTKIDSVTGWQGTHENPGLKNQTEESCRQLALKDPKYVAYGFRNNTHPDPNLRNTCFLYTKGFGPFAGTPGETVHKTGCLRPGELVSLGCQLPPIPPAPVIVPPVVTPPKVPSTAPTPVTPPVVAPTPVVTTPLKAPTPAPTPVTPPIVAPTPVTTPPKAPAPAPVTTPSQGVTTPVVTPQVPAPAPTSNNILAQVGEAVLAPVRDLLNNLVQYKQTTT